MQQQGEENIEHRTSNVERRSGSDLIRFPGLAFPVEGLQRAVSLSRGAIEPSLAR